MVSKVSGPALEEEKLIIKKKDFITKKENAVARYEIVKEIGKGRYGRVLLATDKITQKAVAIKKVSKWNFYNNELVRKEIKFLTELDHPNIAKLYEWSEDPEDYCLICEYCAGGELFSRIKATGRLTENYAAFLFEQLLLGLNYLHSSGVAHRDLKPENCMLSSEAKDSPLKLIDFGLAKIYSDPKNGRIKMKSRVGTPYYIAPEVLKMDYDEKCDLWSAGVILYACVLGGLPFGGKTGEDVYECINKGFRGFPKTAKLSDPCQDLIRMLLISDPVKRISAKEALEHPWIKTMRSSEKIVEIPLQVVENIQIYQGLQKLKKSVIALIATQLAESETEHLRKIFVSFDDNKDGKISEEELTKHLSHLSNHKELCELMKTLDLDQSGFIEYNEFVAAALPATSYLYIDKLLEAFNTYDINQDSKISAQEIQIIIDKDKTLPESMWPKIVERYDVNKDGFIDFSEFVQMMHAMENEAMILE